MRRDSTTTRPTPPETFARHNEEVSHPRLVAVAACFGFLSVALGAFATHGLHLSGKPEEWWRTAVQYHQIHAVAALISVLLGVPRASYLFLGGTAVFAGSLYLMALTGATWLGAVTPLGGLLLLAGWSFLAFDAARRSPPA